MIGIEKYLFLLGGYDLEMLEIRNILAEKNLDYLDKQLSWGAKLSDYKQELENLEDDYIIVGIELNKDIEIEHPYLEIDHHNQNSEKKAAIEQVAELLELELNRYQKLVAANDKGYIEAMKEFGASKEEIRKIRRKDRKAQGVKEEDERLAKESIKENMRVKREVKVIKSKTDKFSAIVDRVYPAYKVLIYTNNELTYYGEKSLELAKKYKKEYEQDIYYGGGENGYFGFAAGSIDKDELEEKIKEIIDYVKRL